MPSVSEIEELIKLAKKHKLHRLDAGDVSFEFATKEAEHKQANEVPIIGERMPTDDEMMFYSADSAIQVSKAS